MKFENRYSWADRLLHRLAFSTGGLQVALADIEEQIFKKEISAISVDKPVFVAALPRAGTTVLLNLLVGTGAFVSHTYRDMPFVLCPMMWQRFSKNFHVADEARERAHGDGLNVSVDSPEAFEEVVWRQFWRRHYRNERIEVWQRCDNPEFVEFLSTHIRKVIALRSDVLSDKLRYVSKNNLNIARLACLADVLPEAKIIVPFRDPIQQSYSLLKQHLSFLDTHRMDPFSKRYMRGIGHFDFGENLLPVNFDKWMERRRENDDRKLSFWLEYWIATYEHVLERASESVRVLSYRTLTEEKESALSWLASEVGLETPASLVAQTHKLRTPRMHDVDLTAVPPELVNGAKALAVELERVSRF